MARIDTGCFSCENYHLECDSLRSSLAAVEAERDMLKIAGQMYQQVTNDLLEQRDALKARAEAAEAQVAKLQRLGAEGGACITELLASVRMWRERSEALSALVEQPDVSIREDASDAPLKPRSDNDSCRPSWAKDTP